MEVIGLAGMPGSGKGEIANVAQELSIPVFSIGDIVREHFSKEMPNEDKAKMNAYSGDRKKRFGNTYWAYKLVEKLVNSQFAENQKIIIDGLRSSEEVDLFRNIFGSNFKTISVHCSPKVRFERLKLRARGDDSQTYEGFLERDSRELEWGSGKVIATSDIILQNHGTLEELQAEIRKILNPQSTEPQKQEEPTELKEVNETSEIIDSSDIDIEQVE